MQKYTILGITLYDYGAREALRNTDSFLHNGALNTIAYISSSNLAQASKDEQLKDCLEAIDMTVCTEPDVLEAAGIAGRNRIREIDERYISESCSGNSEGTETAFIFLRIRRTILRYCRKSFPNTRTIS